MFINVYPCIALYKFKTKGLSLENSPKKGLFVSFAEGWWLIIEAIHSGKQMLLSESKEPRPETN
jgi:hypothetical protein